MTVFGRARIPQPPDPSAAQLAAAVARMDQADAATLDALRGLAVNPYRDRTAVDALLDVLGALRGIRAPADEAVT